MDQEAGPSHGLIPSSGTKNPTGRAVIGATTSSSMSVKPLRRLHPCPAPSPFWRPIGPGRCMTVPKLLAIRASPVLPVSGKQLQAIESV